MNWVKAGSRYIFVVECWPGQAHVQPEQVPLGRKGLSIYLADIRVHEEGTVAFKVRFFQFECVEFAGQGLFCKVINMGYGNENTYCAALGWLLNLLDVQ